MRDERLNNIQAEMQHLTNLKRQLREQEKSLDVRAKTLAEPAQFQRNNVKEFKEQMGANLAPHMLPSNVGALNEVAWPFFFQVDIDFGQNPELSINRRVRSFFQVDQEAAFLLMSVSVAYSKDDTNNSALESAPVQVEFIDRQSSRRFNNSALPLQMIGTNSNPMIMPTPMYIQPNAILDVEASGMQETPFSYAGSGKVQFSFFGYRTRVENAQNILSTIFG
jgi:hypothetical protein